MPVIDDRSPAAFTTTGSTFVTIPGSTLRTRHGDTGSVSITYTNPSTAQTAIVQVIASDDDPGVGADLDTAVQTCVVLDETHLNGGGTYLTLAKSNVPQAYTEDHAHFLFYAVQAKDGDGHGLAKVHLVAKS